MKQTMKKRIRVAVFCVLLMPFAGFGLLPDPAPFALPDGKPVLIAHAGGLIDGYAYTNSLEAVQQSIAAGFRFIELDLFVLPDGDIAAIHDWKEFWKAARADIPETVTAGTLREQRLYGKYTPLTAEDIVPLFSGNDRYLVTDKRVPPELLLEKLPLDRERLLVKVFSYGEYVSALRAGIRYPMLSVRNSFSFWIYRPLFVAGKITMITTKKDMVEKHPDLLASLVQGGVTVFASTVNDKVFVERYLGGVGQRHLYGFPGACRSGNPLGPVYYQQGCAGLFCDQNETTDKHFPQRGRPGRYDRMGGAVS